MKQKSTDRVLLFRFFLTAILISVGAPTVAQGDESSPAHGITELERGHGEYARMAFQPKGSAGHKGNYVKMEMQAPAGTLFDVYLYEEGDEGAAWQLATRALITEEGWVEYTFPLERAIPLKTGTGSCPKVSSESQVVVEFPAVSSTVLLGEPTALRIANVQFSEGRDTAVPYVRARPVRVWIDGEKEFIPHRSAWLDGIVTTEKEARGVQKGLVKVRLSADEIFPAGNETIPELLDLEGLDERIQPYTGYSGRVVLAIDGPAPAWMLPGGGDSVNEQFVEVFRNYMKELASHAFEKCGIFRYELTSERNLFVRGGYDSDGVDEFMIAALEGLRSAGSQIKVAMSLTEDPKDWAGAMRTLSLFAARDTAPDHFTVPASDMALSEIKPILELYSGQLENVDEAQGKKAPWISGWGPCGVSCGDQQGALSPAAWADWHEFLLRSDEARAFRSPLPQGAYGKCCRSWTEVSKLFDSVYESPGRHLKTEVGHSSGGAHVLAYHSDKEFALLFWVSDPPDVNPSQMKCREFRLNLSNLPLRGWVHAQRVRIRPGEPPTVTDDMELIENDVLREMGEIAPGEVYCLRLWD